MKITVLAVAAALSLATAAAHAESEGAGDPFAFQAPGAATVNPPAYADTGSSAFPVLAGRFSQVVIAGGPSTAPMAGSEGIVQTVASLPRRFSAGTVSDAQARSMARFFAQREERARLAAHSSAKTHRG